MSTFKEDLLSNVQTFWATSDEGLADGKYRKVIEISAKNEENFELEFLREFVARNRPCLIKDLKEVQDWPIFSNLSSLESFEDYLIKEIDEIPINFTPNGLADAVTKVEGSENEILMKAYEKSVSPEVLFENLRDKPINNVAYLSEQNNNLKERFDDMLYKGLVSEDLNLGKACFGATPDAVNLWIGDERSVSSLHRDFYENLYCVTHGNKRVHMFPPIAQSFVKEKEFRQGRYEKKNEDDVFEVILESEEEKVTWATVDPVRDQNKDLERLGLVVDVGPGDVLYIPAMWYHRVTQTETTVAVNYWYNMEFDHKWYVHFILTIFIGCIKASWKHRCVACILLNLLRVISNFDQFVNQGRP